MAVTEVDRLFAGSIPQLYDEYMVPLIFEPYAVDLASRVAMCQPSCVLEIAAGTGVVTRHLASALRPEVQIIATDLRLGGTFIFNVWDTIDQNEFADAVTCALQKMFPADPPRFMARVPHGYSVPELSTKHLAEGGFARPPRLTTLAEKSRATSASIPAIAYCQGTLLKSEIEARGPLRLVEATDAATTEIRQRFGQGAVEGKIQAHIITTLR